MAGVESHLMARAPKSQESQLIRLGIGVSVAMARFSIWFTLLSIRLTRPASRVI